MCEDKITEIYVTIDDFNQLFEKEIKQLRLESSSKKRNRKSKLSDSEMMTILICFHLSRINNFKAFYHFYLTKANVDDRDMKVTTSLTENIFGKLFGDRGYISQKPANYLWNDGIDFIYKVRKNMKKQNLSDGDKILLRKRALIESVNDELKNICSIEHSRHRSATGFLINLVSGLCAYHFLPQKPSLNIQPFKNENKQLLLAVA
ncbi:transposase [Flavobacteriaceae bacterium Ap0902]|nr:transposase [Flavobacteriaceae bacterium Ap0902]